LESDVAFDYAKQLVSANSPSEMLELWTRRVRKEFELLTEETKELECSAREWLVKLLSLSLSGVTEGPATPA
jgi:hypothetical protein